MEGISGSVPRDSGRSSEAPHTKLSGLQTTAVGTEPSSAPGKGEGVGAGKSTIQIKHFGNARRPSFSGKAKELAVQGLADDYMVITNAGVSGAAEARICQAFEKVGVQRCCVSGGDWVATQLRSRSSLRMLIPRIYNLVDLPPRHEGVPSPIPENEALATVTRLGRGQRDRWRRCAEA